MPGFTNYLEEKLIRHTFGGAAFAQPAGIHASLFTTAPGETGGGTEVSGAGYARCPVAMSFILDAGSGRWIASNAVTVLFPVAGAGGWGTVTWFALFDAATGGNMLAYAQLTDPASGFVTPMPKAVDYGDAIRFEPAALQVALD
ncbi:MAG TPA: hypothetical protein VGM87_17445 [Roseomonas sp.]|jgi:hypothetical protein